MALSVSSIEWSDLRYFLAVARSGSTQAAARDLGVNQTTCARRITALEEALGTELFERGREGYRLLPNAIDLVASAERVEADIKAFVDEVAGAGRRLSGSIRISTNAPLANAVVIQAVRDFRAAYPDIQIDLAVEDRRADVARGEADVALRAGAKPTDPCLVARQIGVAGWAFYCSRSYARERGKPTSAAELQSHAVVRLAGAAGEHLEQFLPLSSVVCTSNSLPDLCSMLKVGIGISALPCIVGDVEPELERCFEVPDIGHAVWIVYHERLRGEPHLRAFLDFLTAHVLAKRALLAGNRPQVAEQIG